MSNRRNSRRAQLIASLPEEPFDRSAALAIGVSVDQLRTLVRLGCVARVSQGLYVVPQLDAPDPALWIRARAARLGEETVVAHASAATLWQLRTPFVQPVSEPVLWVLRDREAIGAHRQPDIRILPALYEEQHVTRMGHLAVTTLARTAMDLARGCPFERALIVIDHALALGVRLFDLISIAVHMNGWPGSRVFRPALLWADALSESALESLARGRALACGLPAPTPQHQLAGRSGASYRGDLVWPEAHVILELDGRDKFDSGRAAVIAEKDREDDLRAAGWNVVRMTYDHIFDERRTRWLQLAEHLGVHLGAYNPEFGMKPRWERHPRTTRDVFNTR